MKANNSFAPQQEKKTFSMVITGNSMQNMISNSLGDKKSAARFTSTLISIVAASPQLKQCKPDTIISSALRGEGMGLIYGHGYYVVPYGDVATFLTGYKGYIQLAMSTGYYADIDCVEVREGEYRGRNPRTGKLNIDLSVYESDEERLKHPIIGYYGYFELKDGTFRFEYWPMEKLLKHADRYSPAFSLEKYNAMVNGTLDASEIARLKNGTPWYDVDGGQEKMCRKTVIRQLLTSGFAPLSNEVTKFFKEDSNDPVIPDTSFVVDGESNEPVATVVAEETVEETPVEAVEAEIVEPVKEPVPEQKPVQRTARAAKPAAPTQEDFEAGFFGGM